jgi:hypothetical protein
MERAVIIFLKGVEWKWVMNLFLFI